MVRMNRSTVARITRLLESRPGANHSINSFSSAAVEAVLDLIDQAPGDRTEPALVRVFDAFGNPGPNLIQTTKPNPKVAEMGARLVEAIRKAGEEASGEPPADKVAAGIAARLGKVNEAVTGGKKSGRSMSGGVSGGKSEPPAR